jgi:uncharacterized membrane protein YphA (DoxX/SURF4 family)
MTPALDPVVAHATASALAAVFLLAGLGKLRDPALFRATVDNYRLLPEPLVAAFAWLLPLAECAAGVLLFADGTRATGSLLAALLLVLVSIAVAVNIRRGRTHLDCGCGLGTEVPIGPGLLVRNAVLVAAALLLLLPVAPRATVWLDLVAALFLALFLFGLQALATALLAQHARLQSLRNLP